MVRALLTSDTHYGFSRRTHKIHERFLNNIKEEIEAKDIKVVIHAGDWSSCEQHQFRRTLVMFRKYIDIPIVCVRGNHDFWQDMQAYDRRKVLLFNRLLEQHRKWFKENNIHHLENNPFEVGDSVIVGFDGWYGSDIPPSRDLDYMPKWMSDGAGMHSFLMNKAHKELGNLLQMDLSRYRRLVCVTHHPPYSKDPRWHSMCANLNYMQFIVGKFDIFCSGHSHQYRDDMQDNCRVISCNSDYDKPSYIVFEI